MPHRRVDQRSGVRQIDSWNEKDLWQGKREEIQDNPDWWVKNSVVLNSAVTCAAADSHWALAACGLPHITLSLLKQPSGGVRGTLQRRFWLAGSSPLSILDFPCVFRSSSVMFCGHICISACHWIVGRRSWWFWFGVGLFFTRLQQG